MTRTRRLPQRSCVACRQTRGKLELVRIVRTPSGEVHLDESGKLAGRGAYLCRNERCLEQAVKQNKLTRALAAPVTGEVAEAVRKSIEGRLAHRQGEEQ